VLLAASVPARPGERVLEGGSGAGAALLCLAARVPGLTGVGVERDPALAGVAAANAAANGFSALSFVAASVADAAVSGAFDHAMANPPYHPAAGTASPDHARDNAKRAPSGLFATWAMALGRPLRRQGTLTLIVPAAVLPACLDAARQADCPAAAVLPLWPKAGHPAKLLLLRGVKQGRSRMRLLPGLVLHRPDGGFTEQAEAILRGGAPLDWG
jgi:tRNA1(Val) A37 N6-methylase TrmN6